MAFIIFRAFKSMPGLSVPPPTQEAEPSVLHAVIPGHYACNCCGTVLENGEPPSHSCDRCGTRH
ncbi:hypothetical protein [Archangium gephyra]|nr:hypothetical protein [Archangium gephyra]AKJ08359.1 Hypothetical protein AA314_09985 [Archangium gephyra]